MGRRRSLLAVTLAVLLATLLPRAAFASAPWSSDCANYANSNQVCIYRDWYWAGNIAHMSGSNFSYDGETWPSSTYAVNDSISSTKNLYGSYRVRWWRDTNWGGGYTCNNANEGWYWLPLYWNDVISSHEVTSGNC
jgi:hypothetical protein